VEKRTTALMAELTEKEKCMCEGKASSTGNNRDDDQILYNWYFLTGLNTVNQSNNLCQIAGSI